ncbi:hypothetical protein NW765_012693 [Fusarium oxysporum]|nr:hypothetical protein NW765_012693 [Fusarium oxysporum]KAJ4278502.1 hypothetical protein NW764_007299 [Fusarium oxysporum]
MMVMQHQRDPAQPRRLTSSSNWMPATTNGSQTTRVDLQTTITSRGRTPTRDRTWTHRYLAASSTTGNGACCGYGLRLTRVSQAIIQDQGNVTMVTQPLES